MPRLQTKRVAVERDATEAICLEAFRPFMRGPVERGQRFPRDAELVRSFPQFFGLLLPLSALKDGDENG
jgi:hypothetical protein